MCSALKDAISRVEINILYTALSDEFEMMNLYRPRALLMDVLVYAELNYPAGNDNGHAEVS